MRGCGNEWDEQAEEELDFEDDMEVCRENEQGQGMGTKACENEKNEQEQEGKKNEQERKGDSEKSPQILNMRRFRMKKPASQECVTPVPVSRVASSESLASGPSVESPLVPKNLFPTPGKRQSTIGRFFPSPASASGSPWASLDETPLLPPLKRQARIIDAVHALLRQGFITSDGKLIEAKDEAATRVQQEVVRKHPGGRPKKDKLRGVAGGHRSNVRMKGEKQLRQDLPISHQHAVCQHLFKEKEKLASERGLMRYGKKKFGVRMTTLSYIWARRKQWAEDMQKYKQSASIEDRAESRGAQGVHGQGKAKTQRVRASGAGAKLEFPELYEKPSIGLRLRGAMGMWFCQGMSAGNMRVFWQRNLQD